MAKIQVNLNGESVCIGGPGPQAQKFIDFINAIPDGKYFDAVGISRCLKLNQAAVEMTIRRLGPELDGHFLIVPNSFGGGRRKIYGNKASIKKLAKQLQEQDII